MNKVKIRDFTIGGGSPLVLIAGPCVLEEMERCLLIGRTVKEITSRLGIPYIFKASFDKANRSSFNSFRGPGLKKGLEMLQAIKEELDVPVVTDVHKESQIAPAAKVVDVLQIPAFLCRQTDLIYAAAKSGCVVNVKKGQFLAPRDMGNVVDMRSFPIMRTFGAPVIFDATHSVQLPGGAGTSSGGNREFVEPLARAAVAAGVDGLFMEVHDNPEEALCDGPNSLYLDKLEELLKEVLAIYDVVKGKLI